jgi:hypothetical protein
MDSNGLKNIKYLLKKHNKESKRIFNKNYSGIIGRKKFINRILNTDQLTQYISEESKHLAIAIYDYLSSMYKFSPKIKEKIQFVCLSLASKLRDSQETANLYSLLTLTSDKNYIFSLFFQFEMQVLKLFNFNIRIITPFDFLVAFLELDESLDGILIQEQKFYSMLIFELVCKCTLEYKLNKFSSLGVSLCVLMVVRSFFKCEVILPKVLETLTGYNLKVLDICYHKIKIIFRKMIERC